MSSPATVDEESEVQDVGGRSARPYQMYLTAPSPVEAQVTGENLPSKLTAADQPFNHLISADAVVNAVSSY